MLNVTCRICGGELDIDIRSDAVYCEFCGGRQLLSMTDHAVVVDPAKLPTQTIQQYRQAYRALAEAGTGDQYAAAAQKMDQLAGFCEADELAREAREMAAQCRMAEKYTAAVEYFNGSSIEKIQLAARLFAELGDYRDAAQRLEQCPGRIAQMQQVQRDREIEQKKAQLALEKQEAKEERRRQKQEKRRIRKRKFKVFMVLLLIVALILGGFMLHSRKNLQIQLRPDEDYYEVKRDRVIFYYDVTLENSGYLDINGFDAAVIFENTDGEVLVDTKMYIDNYDTAAVRGKKTVTMSWELSVYSEDAAWELINTDFEDLKVTIEITEIRFSTGLTRTY